MLSNTASRGSRIRAAEQRGCHGSEAGPSSCYLCRGSRRWSPRLTIPSAPSRSHPSHSQGWTRPGVTQDRLEGWGRGLEDITSPCWMPPGKAGDTQQAVCLPGCQASLGHSMSPPRDALGAEGAQRGSGQGS